MKATAYLIRVRPEVENPAMQWRPYLKSIEAEPLVGIRLRWTSDPKEALLLTARRAQSLLDALWSKTGSETYFVEGHLQELDVAALMAREDAIQEETRREYEEAHPPRRAPRRAP